jgi:hypothetical protein
VFTYALREQGNMNSHMAYVRMTVHRDKNVMSYYVSVSEQISTIPPFFFRIRSPLIKRPHKEGYRTVFKIEMYFQVNNRCIY